MLAVSHDFMRSISIIVLYLVVMILNWLAMWYARAIMRWGAVGRAILGIVLSVLQVALGLQIILRALAALHVVPNQ
jgi:small neutral amino acid transporter SnatA (MarC family)